MSVVTSSPYPLTKTNLRIKLNAIEAKLPTSSAHNATRTKSRRVRDHFNTYNIMLPMRDNDKHSNSKISRVASNTMRIWIWIGPCAWN